MVKLADLGFCEGIVFETIVSTYNENGYLNAAPMGIIMQDERQLIINLFNSSLTYKNLHANKSAVINLTSNIEFFYKTAFKETNINGTLPQEWFEKAETVNAPKLKFADATIEITVNGMTPISNAKTRALCNVKLVNESKAYPHAYCRAMSAAVEAIIHATRVKALINDEQEQEHVAKLLELIQNCNDVVNRVATKSQYSEIMADLLRRIDLWRAKT
jgi:hypothetical protein